MALQAMERLAWLLAASSSVASTALTVARQLCFARWTQLRGCGSLQQTDAVRAVVTRSLLQLQQLQVIQKLQGALNNYNKLIRSSRTTTGYEADWVGHGEEKAGNTFKGRDNHRIAGKVIRKGARRGQYRCVLVL